MRHCTLARAAASLAPAVLILLACGNKPADTQAPAAAAPPAAAPAAPPSASDQVAQATPPAAHTPPPAAAEKPPSKPTPRATPKPEATPAPRPQPVAKTIPAGTDLNVELVNGASSATSQVGASVRARVVQPVVIDGVTVIPQGATVNGMVTEAVPLKKIGGQASLGLRFDSIEIGAGQSAAISVLLHEQGKSETGKDAGTIAGAAAGGALLGRLLSHHDKTKGTLIGAAVGAGVGTGVAAGTKGQEVELPAGTPLALHLDLPVTVMIQP